MLSKKILEASNYIINSEAAQALIKLGRAEKKIKVGFTGTSTVVFYQQIEALGTLLDKWEIESVHHGDCIKADEVFHNECWVRHLYIVVHPPIKEDKRAFCEYASEVREPKEYLERNHDIVDETDLLIAMPDSYIELQRSGTWATIRYARKLCRDIYIIYPNGVIEHEKRGDCDN